MIRNKVDPRRVLETGPEERVTTQDESKRRSKDACICRCDETGEGCQLNCAALEGTGDAASKLGIAPSKTGCFLRCTQPSIPSPFTLTAASMYRSVSFPYPRSQRSCTCRVKRKRLIEISSQAFATTGTSSAFPTPNLATQATALIPSNAQKLRRGGSFLAIALRRS